jgi:hypothetical protein
MPAPRHGLAVGFAGAAGGGGDIGHPEPGMIRQEAHILLSHHAGGPKDSYGYLFHKGIVKKNRGAYKGREYQEDFPETSVFGTGSREKGVDHAGIIRYCKYNMKMIFSFILRIPTRSHV